MSKSVRRLFEQFRPEHYELFLEPDRETMAFSGKIKISGQKVGRPSERITLHQKGLKITNVSIYCHDKKGDEEIAISRVNLHRGFSEVRLHAGKPLYPGRYTVTMEFSGLISQTMQGIYLCHFKHNDKEKSLVATQFESDHARKAFPCIDEPEAKATFQLSLVTPKDEVVLSNTPIKKEQTADSKQLTANSKKLHTKNYKLTTFETTPKMSAYLLAFVFGEMHSAAAKTKGGIEVNSWSSIAQPVGHLKYSADEAAKILDFFADYFGLPYPLAKLDQVALPDFDAGAMENWGLVTYREVALLVDTKNRSISSEQYVALVVAHELSHQWFGNLVTMKWWDDLWLNESFAGLMEHIASNALHPDWQQWELYAAGDIPLITSRDVYKDIQPVGVKGVDPELIEALFDPAIVYAKGARLLKMLREYIGDEAFVNGLNDYFKSHAYGNATRDDLWAALSKSSGKDIKTMMTPWLTQPGMPVVHVTQKGRDLNLFQERFLLDAEPDNSIWPVPLLANQAVQSDILTSKNSFFVLESEEPVLLNQYASGQYLVHYKEPGHRQFLASQLKAGRLATEARINLLNDMYVLARHGDEPLTDALDIVRECKNEPRSSVWGLVLRTISAAGQLTEGDTTSEDLLKKLRVGMGKSWYCKLGWDDGPKDDANTKQLRHAIITLMARGENPNTIREAIRRYSSAKSLQDLPAELRDTILAIAVRHGNRSAVDELLVEYSTASPDTQLDISSALGSTKDSKVAGSVLKKALGPKGFARPQDVMRWLAVFMMNYHVREVAWEFMASNWPWLEDTLAESKSFDYLPTYWASVITTDEWAKRYHQFFAVSHKLKTLSHNIDLGEADIKARVAWRKREEAGILKWLKANAS